MEQLKISQASSKHVIVKPCIDIRLLKDQSTEEVLRWRNSKVEGQMGEKHNSSTGGKVQSPTGSLRYTRFKFRIAVTIFYQIYITGASSDFLAAT